MEKKRIAYIIGTRPEIIRSAFIIKAIKKDKQIFFKLVHTGQHYDYQMSRNFFRELNLPAPDVNLNVRSGSHGEQTAKMMIELEKFFLQFNPDIVAVFGDTNSSVAAALTAVKLKIPIAHIEAGCREWEMDLPEEVNRRMIDHCSNLLLAVSDVSARNLKDEKVIGKVFNIGDPLYEVFKIYLAKSKKLGLVDKLCLKKKQYIFLTVHRSGNIDNLKFFKNIMNALSAKKLPIVFSIHPHTRQQLDKLNFSKSKLSNFVFLEPQNYQNTLHLMSNSKITVTDSGGLQKEVFWAHVPCITLRDVTAWSETVDYGVNFLTGADEKVIEKTIDYICKNYQQIQQIFSEVSNPYYQPKTARKILKFLKAYAGKKWGDFEINKI